MAHMKPLKPWRALADQLTLLRERGLEVEDQAAALDYLERLGYYRLSGYWYPLRAIDCDVSLAQGQVVRSDRFLPGSRFETVARLYVFDKRLRLLALDALERIEMAVRVDVAHLLGQDAGKTEHQVWLKKYEALLHRARKEPFVQHHMAQYRALPIWAAVEVWDFGLLSKLFAGMKHADQAHIAAAYGVDSGQVFAQWLRSLNFIRNVAAHHSRLWNINVVERSAVPPSWPDALDNARPFFYFCLMRRLLDVICPRSQWARRLADLLVTDFPAEKNPGLSLEDFGAFAGWNATAPWCEVR